MEGEVTAMIKRLALLVPAMAGVFIAATIPTLPYGADLVVVLLLAAVGGVCFYKASGGKQ